MLIAFISLSSDPRFNYWFTNDLDSCWFLKFFFVYFLNES